MLQSGLGNKKRYRGLVWVKYGKNLSERRKELGITSEHMGNLIGIKGKSYNCYEQGKVIPSRATAEIFQQVLGVPCPHTTLSQLTRGQRIGKTLSRRRRRQKTARLAEKPDLTPADRVEQVRIARGMSQREFADFLDYGFDAYRSFVIFCGLGIYQRSDVVLFKEKLGLDLPLMATERENKRTKKFTWYDATRGQRLRLCRAARGYSQVVVCKKSGVCQTSLSRMENDVANVSEDFFVWVITVLEISQCELYSDNTPDFVLDFLA